MGMLTPYFVCTSGIPISITLFCFFKLNEINMSFELMTLIKSNCNMHMHCKQNNNHYVHSLSHIRGMTFRFSEKSYRNLNWKI